MKREEMKNSAPKLAALKLKAAVFKLPDGALNDVENAVIAEILETQLKSKFGNANPFKVSANYFADFEDALLESLESQNNQSLKSTLKIPDNYFESFEQKVLSKLQNDPIEKEIKVISLRSRIIKISATVSVAVSLVMFFIFNPFQQKSNELSFDSLAMSEIEKWIEQDHLELDAYQIAAVYKETKLQPNLLKSTVNEVELEDFLVNEKIDELLYEE